MKTVQVPPLSRDTRGLKLFPIFTLFGWLLIGFAILAAILVVAPTASGYWGANAKEARDAAALGSALLGQPSTLAFWSKFLPPLLFLGVASFIVGIALEFGSIPAILDRRAALLKQALPLMGSS